MVFIEAKYVKSDNSVSWLIQQLGILQIQGVKSIVLLLHFMCSKIAENTSQFLLDELAKKLLSWTLEVIRFKDSNCYSTQIYLNVICRQSYIGDWELEEFYKF